MISGHFQPRSRFSVTWVPTEMKMLHFSPFANCGHIHALWIRTPAVLTLIQTTSGKLGLMERECE